MAEELKAGDTAMYRGIMVNRQGQKATCQPGPGGLIAATFPDGKTIGCLPTSLVKVEAS